MTGTYTDSPTHLGHTARVAPRPRARVGHARERTVERVGITVTAVAVLAMAVLLVVAPETVLIPLAVVLITGVIVGGLILMIERRTPAPIGAPEDGARRLKRHDAVA